MVFKGELSVKYEAKEFSFFNCFYRRFLSRKLLRSEENTVLLVEVDADCLGSGELKSIL